MKKLQYAVLGHPIGHTMSPFIHERLFQLDGLDADYRVLDISPEALPEEEKRLLRTLDGYNLTIPLKTEIIPLLDELDGKAHLYGSVNTVKNGTIRTGYSTDPYGFLGALTESGISLNGNTVVLGSGGAARIVVFEAALQGASVTIVVRESGREKAERLCADALAVAPNAKLRICSFEELEQETAQIDLLVNATPVGMYPHEDASPVTQAVAARTAAFFDLIYNPEQTVLMKMAEASGAVVIGGMRMLVLQAAEAHRIWHGSTYRREDIDAICADASEEMRRKFRGK